VCDPWPFGSSGLLSSWSLMRRPSTVSANSFRTSTHVFQHRVKTDLASIFRLSISGRPRTLSDVTTVSSPFCASPEATSLSACACDLLGASGVTFTIINWFACVKHVRFIRIAVTTLRMFQPRFSARLAGKEDRNISPIISWWSTRRFWDRVNGPDSAQLYQCETDSLFGTEV
jgi:hypothetical protein